MRRFTALVLFGLLLTAGFARGEEEKKAEEAEDAEDYADEERAHLLVRKWIKEESAVQGRNVTVHLEVMNAGNRCGRDPGAPAAPRGSPESRQQRAPSLRTGGRAQEPESRPRQRPTRTRSRARARCCAAPRRTFSCPPPHLLTPSSPPNPPSPRQRRLLCVHQGRRDSRGLQAA